ncbi:MAG: UDP-N-acetylmuramoyl-L-alanyl-D-glutamate--2,6-diaminopimelate ligase [Proteobacteria bacterium]|nr:UDP-N-acetylmuramoyl-L-alanyl-D-glutamate--2,6-diaminopimelate ligase [Pseudomonadota bacterium]
MTAGPEALEVEITGLAANSRSVRPGYLFAALPGTRVDGRRFIAEAVARGAAAVLAPPGTPAAGVPVIADGNPRRRLARLAARFYRLQPATIAAATGTNGKTSTVVFLSRIWAGLGHKAGSLGTLGVSAPGFAAGGALTTPDPVALHATLAELAGAGVSHLALEASSHGLAQYRLDGVAIRAAAFSNLTRDHLDYHPDLAAYRAAKLRLFSELLPADGVAVLNADMDEDTLASLRAVARRRGLRALEVGRKGREVRILEVRPRPDGLDLALEAEGAKARLALPLVGAFQAANVALALGLALATGAEAGAALQAARGLQAVRGRAERVAEIINGAAVYVDYAHTPDALANVLAALRPHAKGRLVVVFGCGGDRDPGKRPEMGAIAARLADLAVVTDDNPRGEDPAAIRRAILAACPDGREIASRAEAIATAVAGLRPGDVLVIAGKGHESGQIVGGRVLPFDDAAVARDAAAREGGR